MKPDRLIAIGDIHGELDKLKLLLELVAPTAKDQLVFLGDYIDRGPDSRGVIERLIALEKDYPRTIFLRGNHEQMLLEARVEIGADPYAASATGHFMRLYSAALPLWLANGGTETLHSYGVQSAADLPDSHVAFLRATMLYWECENFLFVHAGAERKIPLKDQDPLTLLMSRNCPPGENGMIHIVGHTPTADGLPGFEPGRIWLDTGAAYGRPLTACDLLTHNYWQA